MQENASAVNETAAEETMPKVPRDNANALDLAEIMNILPHRAPFLLIDKVLDYEPGKWAISRKCVTMDEPFFQGHFPGHPVMPGVLILEAMAQTGAVAALGTPEDKGKIALFGGVNKCRFKKQVVPGDVLEIRCELIKRHGPVGIGAGEAKVDGKTVCKAEIVFAISD